MVKMDTLELKETLEINNVELILLHLMDSLVLDKLLQSKFVDNVEFYQILPIQLESKSSLEENLNN
jgi:hypothetical protein